MIKRVTALSTLPLVAAHAVCPTPVNQDYVMSDLDGDGLVPGFSWYTTATPPFCFTPPSGEPTTPDTWGVGGSIQAAFSVWTADNTTYGYDDSGVYFHYSGCGSGDASTYHIYTHDIAYAPDPTLIASTRVVYIGNPFAPHQGHTLGGNNGLLYEVHELQPWRSGHFPKPHL